MALFDRISKLVIGQGGSSGLEIVNLRMAFEIHKTLGKNPNRSEIRVWNLKQSTREELEKPNTRCVLYAGYSEQDGAIKIFEGNVTYAWTSFENAEVVTQFDLGEGIQAYRDTTVTLSYPSGIGTRRVLEDIAQRMGLGLDISPDAQMRQWASGRSFHGSARGALDRVTRASGLSWSIQGGTLQVIQAGGATSRRAVVIAADSGMIGSPERERKGSSQTARVRNEDTGRNVRVNSASREWSGWRVKSLLMPFIVPGDPVKMEGRSANGVFIAREVNHRGDNMEGDWQTELLLVDSQTNTRLTQTERGTTGQRRSR